MQSDKPSKAYVPGVYKIILQLLNTLPELLQFYNLNNFKLFSWKNVGRARCRIFMLSVSSLRMTYFAPGIYTQGCTPDQRIQKEFCRAGQEKLTVFQAQIFS